MIFILQIRTNHFASNQTTIFFTIMNSILINWNLKKNNNQFQLIGI